MNCGKVSMPRRDFLKGLAALGLCATLPAKAGEAPAVEDQEKVPVRPFGRTGFKVSILALGGMFDVPNNQLLLQRCLQKGVTYWDTADCYEGGRSESGIGQFFASHPDARKKVFLVTKSDARDSAGMSRLLQRSLDRMKTDWIDLYFIHGVRHAGELTDETRVWVQRAKKEAKIRLFGFSTHSNMAALLEAAAKMGWIDGIMFSYNFRLMREDRMRRAVELCSEAGIGLTAMKTQGGGPVKPDEATRGEMAAHFLREGFSPEQAKLMAVWRDPRIASVCSQMPNMRILNANIAAALNREHLSVTDEERLRVYAAQTASTYCAGCAEICAKASGGLPINDVVRCVMYEREYDLPDVARREFRRLSRRHRARLRRVTLGAAEAACPAHLPIGSIVRYALQQWS